MDKGSVQADRGSVQANRGSGGHIRRTRGQLDSCSVQADRRSGGQFRWQGQVDMRLGGQEVRWTGGQVTQVARQSGGQDVT